MSGVAEGLSSTAAARSRVTSGENQRAFRFAIHDQILREVMIEPQRNVSFSNPERFSLLVRAPKDSRDRNGLRSLSSEKSP